MRTSKYFSTNSNDICNIMQRKMVDFFSISFTSFSITNWLRAETSTDNLNPSLFAQEDGKVYFEEWVVRRQTSIFEVKILSVETLLKGLKYEKL